jgi:hypothetical protein
MTDTSGAAVRWRKSSFSGGDNGDCIELSTKGVRDSKNVAATLSVSWRGLLDAVKADRIAR